MDVPYSLDPTFCIQHHRKMPRMIFNGDAPTMADIIKDTVARLHIILQNVPTLTNTLKECQVLFNAISTRFENATSETYDETFFRENILQLKKLCYRMSCLYTKAASEVKDREENPSPNADDVVQVSATMDPDEVTKELVRLVEYLTAHTDALLWLDNMLDDIVAQSSSRQTLSIEQTEALKKFYDDMEARSKRIFAKSEKEKENG